MLERIHYNHLGINKCKARARECLYWPGMSKQIEDLISNCDTCLQFQVSNRKEPLIPKEIPSVPFQVVGTDLFHFQNNNFLLIIDYFSKFVDFFKLTDLSSETTIIGLKSFFARYGIPKILYSDGGPQYSSRQFKDFQSKWGFDHELSSPHYPQSNGMVERHIQTVKKMLRKSSVNNKDPYLALLEYRNTPISESLPSPAEILFKRKLNGLLPYFAPNKLQMSGEEIKNKLQDRQDKQKFYFDKSARKGRSYGALENVFIPDKQNKLVHAQVVGEHKHPRSYNIKLENGNVVRRNTRHIHRGSGTYPFAVKHSMTGFNLGEYEHLAGENDVRNDRQDRLADRENDLAIRNQGNDVRERGNDMVIGNRNNGGRTISRSGREIRRPRYFDDYVE
ncbi:uncharacterized protein K02A2.6-like [Nilaparvata lugens]|uniref:uncharacterized protein K02A2.6-like n=1 Tax=Nilaparvata lugens TaxID=108931 RepID=UPI00193D54FB|nr:uncharacterized protein K02A2.6-like [Nilaparvata lugens]